MKYAVAAAALVATVSAQSCMDTVPYKFQFSPVNVSESHGAAKRDLNKVSQYVSFPACLYANHLEACSRMHSDSRCYPEERNPH